MSHLRALDGRQDVALSLLPTRRDVHRVSWSAHACEHAHQTVPRDANGNRDGPDARPLDGVAYLVGDALWQLISLNG